jgi:hypothetical protein
LRFERIFGPIVFGVLADEFPAKQPLTHIAGNLYTKNVSVNLHRWKNLRVRS